MVNTDKYIYFVAPPIYRTFSACKVETLYSLSNISAFPLPSSPWQPSYFLFLCIWLIQISYIREIEYLSFVIGLFHHALMSLRFIHFVAWITAFFQLKGWIKCHWMNIRPLVYPFIYQWTRSWKVLLWTHRCRTMSSLIHFRKLIQNVNRAWWCTPVITA